MVKRARRGEKWNIPKVRDANLVADSAETFQNLGLPKGAGRRFQPQYSLVELRNDSGGNLAAGRALEVGAMLTTDLDQDALWFEGDTPAPDGIKSFAVAAEGVADGDVGPFLLSGLVVARLNVNHVQQQWADLDSGSTLLQSKWHGRARIVRKATASTGEQDALVQLGHDFRGPIKVVATSGITAGSSASCAVYWAGSAASPSATITCYLDWMHGGTNAVTDAECIAFWFPDQQKYIITELEC